MINQTWSPMFGTYHSSDDACPLLSAKQANGRIIDMMNIFEVFLPQLLRYPNPSDPLNGEAAALLMRHPKEYELKVKGTYEIFCIGTT